MTTTVIGSEPVVVSEVDAAVGALGEAVERFASVDLDALTAYEQLALVRRVEVLRRRLDAGTDRLSGHVDRTAAFSLDGHRSVKGALKAIGRLSGAEALGRARTARALRQLPLVEAAYVRGAVPTEHVRALARTVSNPRVAEHVAGADAIFAEQAATLGYDDFVAFLREWERTADADGADQSAEESHERRRFDLIESAITGTFLIGGVCGALQGAVMAEVLERYERAELEADWAEARARYGDDARVEHLARTPAQRRADALFEIFRRAGSTPADARSPEPLVNVVIDWDTWCEELRRAAGEDVVVDPNESVQGRRCHSVDGTALHPGDVVAAALVGHVRRVVVDGAGNVIDLGRRRRLFTGSSRDAALLQALLRGPGGLRCLWPGCDGRGRCLQVDHRAPARNEGRTDVANSDAYCGSHGTAARRGDI